MTEIIVDTDVLSFLFKNHPIGQLYGADVAGRAGGISFMTVASLSVGPCCTDGVPSAFTGCTFSPRDSRLYHPARTFAASGPR